MPQIRVRATDTGWDGLALKLRAVGEEFELPENQLHPDWMERVDGKEIPRPKAPKQKEETESAGEVKPTEEASTETAEAAAAPEPKRPGRPRKQVI